MIYDGWFAMILHGKKHVLFYDLPYKSYLVRVDESLCKAI